MHAEIKAALDEQTKLLKDYQTEIDKGREADQDAIAKMDKAIVDLQLRLERLGREATSENKGDEPDEAKQALIFESTVREAPVDAENARIGLDDFRAYRKAFSRYLRRPADRLLEDDRKALMVGESKALSVGIEADGGYWVTPVMSDQIIRRQFETSPMRVLASVITITSDAVEFPVDPNDATTGGWVGETDSRSETATPQIGSKRIPVHEQYANPRSTQKLLDDAAFNVEAWLAGRISDKLTRDENDAFVNGNGTAKPTGFLDYASAAVATPDASRSWGVLEYIATGASAGFDTGTVDATASPADELIDVIAALKPVYRPNAVWTMPRAVEAEVRKLKDANGNFLITQNTGNITGAPLGGFSLLGYPIVNFEDMPALAADSFSAAFGDFRAGYMIVDRQGVRVLRDPFSAKPYVQFYTTKRVGGDVIDFDAIKLLKFGTS